MIRSTFWKETATTTTTKHREKTSKNFEFYLAQIYIEICHRPNTSKQPHISIYRHVHTIEEEEEKKTNAQMVVCVCVCVYMQWLFGCKARVFLFSLVRLLACSAFSCSMFVCYSTYMHSNNVCYTTLSCLRYTYLSVSRILSSGMLLLLLLWFRLLFLHVSFVAWFLLCNYLHWLNPKYKCDSDVVVFFSCLNAISRKTRPYGIDKHTHTHTRYVYHS